MKKIRILLIPHRSLLTPLLALLLAAQAPCCIRQYDDFVGAQDVASDNRAADGKPGDASGGDVVLDSTQPDVPEPKDTTDIVHTDFVQPDVPEPKDTTDTVHTDTVEVDICVPDCTDKECGSDGCGGSCGSCSGGQSCQAGQCEVVCGDGQCDVSETQCGCSQDCGMCPGCCEEEQCKFGSSDFACGQEGEACSDCTADEESCVNQECQCACGDGMCCITETCCTCSSDCGSCCGNGQCDCGETYQTCLADCESPVQCNPSCDLALEECVAVTTGGFECTAKMVEVLAGNFWMGCNNCLWSTVNDTSCDDDEHPYHEVYLDTYEIDKTEVTAAQYGACVTAGGCTAAGTGSLTTYQVSGKENHPINYVNWGQVEGYCLWAGKELCTEAQWEKGARGGCEYNGGPSNCKADSRKYPWWGNAAPTCDLAVMSGCPGDTQPVCSKSPPGDSPYGLCDMAGNVWEWVADWYGSDYYCAGSGADTSSPWTYCPECGTWPDFPNAWNNPYCNIGGSSRVKRGGSFYFFVVNLRVSDRAYGVPSGSYFSLGGRCCRSE